MTQAALLALLVALQAPSKRPPATPQHRLQLGQSQFARGEFEAALRQLDLAADQAEDDATLAKIHLLRGQCFGAQRELVRAEEAFARALEHDPEASLDPTRVDPSLVSLLEGLKGRLTGELTVRAEPANARVTLDGRPLGSAPLKAMVPIGRHRLEARSADGRLGARETVLIRPKRSSTVQMELKRLPDAPAPPARTAPAAQEGVTLAGGKPIGDLRLQLDPFQLLSEGAGIEIGAGLEWAYWRGSFHVRVFPTFGFGFRGALTVPLVDQFRGYVQLELPIWITNDGPAAGLGGAGGVEFLPIKWVTVFAELGARQFFLAPPAFDTSRLTLQLGTRLRLP